MLTAPCWRHILHHVPPATLGSFQETVRPHAVDSVRELPMVTEVSILFNKSCVSGVVRRPPVIRT